MANEFIVTFKKPYEFENETYESVDLSGIEDLTASDLIEADKMFLNTGNMAAMNEMTVAYSMIVASKATKKPLEFFHGLKINDATQVKAIVTNFFFG